MEDYFEDMRDDRKAWYLTPQTSTEWTEATQRAVQQLVGRELTVGLDKAGRVTHLGVEGGSVRETLRERITRETDELEQAALLLAGQLTRRSEQLEALRKYPDDDPFEDGTVLRFAKRFPNSDQEYSYVAHRVNGLWYQTGRRSPQGMNWDQFVDFMGLGVDAVYDVATGDRVIG